MGNTMENRQLSPCFNLAWSSAGDTDKFGIIIKYNGMCIATREGRGGWEDWLRTGGGQGGARSRKDTERRW